MSSLNPIQTGRVLPQMPDFCAYHMQHLSLRVKEDGSHEWYCPACEAEEATIAAAISGQWAKERCKEAHRAGEVPFTTA
ncbi:MAG: hypothetical protein A4E65_02609 [Syntrophorhabdus sp. PtaU1.Bin153]|nr:MAG: hypothetical protein A4E65_02609 [Syntrophorhabdus sp. PtaU1.Bin153]